MNTKIASILIILLFALSSCQDVIDLEVPDGDIQLVVDGWLTNQPGEKEVRLATTANYFNNTTIPPVQNALVLLYSEQGLLDTLKEREAGLYTTEYVGQVGETYRLYIRTVEGEEYESLPEELRAVPEISAVYATFQEETIFDDEGYYISIDTQEPVGQGDHYRWKQYVNGEYLNEPDDLLYASDEFVDGNPILGFEVSGDPLVVGDFYRIEQLSISKNAFDFLVELETQTAFVGSLFDSPPAALKGNIINLDSDGKKALGFFGVSALTAKEILIEE
ncbi:MAG: DUF4249 domain-containing protein [Bacteroidota bacterium]